MIARTRSPALVRERQADEAAAGVRVGVRRPLAGKIGQEEQAVAAGGHGCGLGGEQFVGVDLFLLRLGHDRGAQGVAEPLQRSASRKVHAHHVPLAADGVAEGVDAALRVDLHFVAVDEDHAGGAQRGGEYARGDDAVAHGAGRAVARPADHEAIGGKAQLGCGCRGELAGDFFRFITAGQQARIEFQLGEQLGRPSPLGHVQEQHAAGVADFRGELAGQAAADFVLGQEHFLGLLEILRLVVPQPEDLWGGEAGQGRVGDHADKGLAPARTALDLFALGGGPLVVPEDRAADHFAIAVEEDRAMHLAGKADRLDIARLELGRLDHAADGGDGRLPPVVRVLFAPKRFGMVEWIGLQGGSEDVARGVDGQGFGARRADVDAQECAHGFA